MSEIQNNVNNTNTIKHKELSYRIVGLAQGIHRTLGPGFPEAVYHKAFCHELVKTKIPFENEKSVDVFYDGLCCGTFRLDILVDNKIAVELKAIAAINGEHVAQVISYLKATNLDLGILINFGRSSLETKRVVL